jgi:hypothetical protein
MSLNETVYNLMSIYYQMKGRSEAKADEQPKPKREKVIYQAPRKITMRIRK